MWMRFFIYGALGWVVEIVWTGLGSLLRRDPKLRATTYLWMFPIYGSGGMMLETLHHTIAAQPWMVRGVVWAVTIFSIEYVAGALIRRAVGTCPWDYTGARFSVHGLIRLDYAPAWFALGLMFEQVHKWLQGL